MVKEERRDQGVNTAGNRDPIIGTCLFTDGPREVYEDSHGQYVLDYQGMKVYGIWIYAGSDVETPIVVEEDA